MGRYRVVTADRLPEFLDKGYRKRHFFPHTLRYLPKPGPGAVRLSGPMCGTTDLAAHWEVVLHALPVAAAEFPRDLFFDDDIVWHRQHYGLEAHVAFAFVVVEGERMFGLNYVSDVVQRISRRRELRTRVETVFHGWAHMLLHGLLNLAAELGVRTFLSPGADLVMENSRPAGRALFERIYDRIPADQFHAARQGRWWAIDVRRERDRLVPPERREAVGFAAPTVSVIYDTGALLAGAPAMAGSGTYVAPPRPPFHDLCSRASRSCFAFTAEDALSPRELRMELLRCRAADQRVRGYRLPHARPPDPDQRYELCYHKFDWLLIHDEQFGSATPALERAIVSIPVTCDDRDLTPAAFERWSARALRRLAKNGSLVLSLRSNWWRCDGRRRQQFLDTISSRAEPTTCDKLADELILGRAL